MTIALPEPQFAPVPVARPSIADKLRYCEALAGSGMLPRQYKQQPANLLYAVEYADSLGLHPMVAITGVHVIEGKPSASSALISALVRRAGHKLRVKGDATTAVAQIVRTDDPDWTFEVRFTIEDARRAGLLGKDVWKRYPASMLKARAITAVARDACEEALFGIHYTPEELGAVVDQEGNPVYLAGEVQHDTGEQPPAEAGPSRDYLAEAEAAADANAVRALWAEAKAEGAPEHYLDQLAAIGRDRAAAEQQATATEDAVEAEATDDGHRAAPEQPAEAVEDDEHAVALGEMYDAAKAAGCDAAEAEGLLAVKHETTPQQATPAQLREMRDDLLDAARSAAA